MNYTGFLVETRGTFGRHRWHDQAARNKVTFAQPVPAASAATRSCPGDVARECQRDSTRSSQRSNGDAPAMLSVSGAVVTACPSPARRGRGGRYLLTGL